MKGEDKSIDSNNEKPTFIPFWNTADPYYYSLLKDKRKRMRDYMTEAEKILWEHLKGDKLGVRFRRQHMIECFIPDFVALSCKLIIEVDGEVHKFQKEYDSEREQFLIEKGYRLIRFENDEVLKNIESVIERIRENI